MSTQDATIAQPPEALSNGDLAAFALRPEFFLESYGCAAHVRDGLLLDVGEALREGDGVIVTDDPMIQRTLRESHSVMEVAVPEDALITSHQFEEPHSREGHPRLHDVPAGKGIWGAEEAESEPVAVLAAEPGAAVRAALTDEQRKSVKANTDQSA